MKTFLNPKRGYFPKAWALILVVLAAFPALVCEAANISWSGGTASYTNAVNWLGGVVPGAADNAINDNGTNNVVQVNVGNPDWTLNQIRAGNGAGSGAFAQNGQIVTLTGTNLNGAVVTVYNTPFRLGIAAGRTGVYTLDGGTINYNNGAFNVGELGTGILNINGGTITGGGNFAANPGGIGTPNAVTGTAGNGPTEGDFTWFEQGFYTVDPSLGLPPAGSTITSDTQPDHSYAFASSYTANNAVVVSANLTSATITPTAPALCSGLSFVGSAGNGPANVNYTVHHADSTTETGSLSVPDWFASGQQVMAVRARVDALGVNFQIPGNAPYLWSLDIPLTGTNSAVTSIDLSYASGGVACLMAVSRQAPFDVPFTPMTITGYNEDVVVEAGAQSHVSGSVTDLVNQAAGTINITGEFWVGNYGDGIYNFSGGTNSFQNWLALGRSGGHGTLNMTGGELNKIGNGNFLIGTGYQAPAGSSPSGVVNQSAGTINSQGEFSIPENSPASGTYNLSGTGVLNVNNWMQVGRSGGTGIMTMSGGSVTKNGGGNFIVGDNATGTLTQTGGSININSGESWIGQGGSANGLYNMGGGSFACLNNWISIGRNGGTGTLNLTNGSFTKAGGGNFSIGGDGGATGTLNQFGGSVSNAVNPGSFTYVGQGGGNGTWTMNGGTAVVGTLRLCENGSGSGTVNLNNGSLSVSEVNAGGAASTFNLNGGTVLARADNPNFFHDLGTASVQAGGAVFDSQGFNVTVAQSLTDGGGGGLTKNGAGTLTLSGANSYTGTTTVNGGTLAIRTDSTANGNYSIAGTAQLGLTVLALNAQLSVANLTLASPTPALGFDLGNFGNPATAPLNVVSALSVNGTVTVNVTDSLPQAGQFPLIKYGTRSGAGSFVIGSLPVGVAASLSNNVANNSIDLVITSVNLPRWEGLAGGNWDIGLTTNWINIGNGLPTFYGQGNAVLFNDSALGTTTVNLTTTLNPSSVTLNNSSLAYALNGSGKISGSTALTKQGSGVATIANTGGNNYTGLTAIQGGVLSVTSLANGGSPSAIGASSASPNNLVLAGGTLSYSGPPVSINRGYSVQATNSSIDTVSNLTLSGLATATTGGSFIKAGSAQLTYTTAGTNTLSGPSSPGFLVQDGTVLFDGSAGGQTNIVQGDRLGINGVTANASVVLTNTTIQVSGNVDLGNVPSTTGTLIVNSNVNLTVGSWLVMGDGANSVGTVTLNGGTVNVNSGALLMGGNAGTTSTLNINGGVLNKSGGTVIVAPGDWNGVGARTGTINQSGGTFTFSDEIQLGQVAQGTGFYNLHGGVVNSTSWFVIGRAGGSGTMIMDGGILNHTSGGQPAFIVGSGAGNNSLASVGILNHSAGTINCSSEYWVGENTLAVGTNNISGTAVVNVGNWVSLGRGGHAVVNFSGGTFAKTGGGNFIVGDNGNAYLNQTGGALTINNELWIGQAGGGVGQYDLSAGTVTNNSWLAVGRESATGILNISGGSMTKTGGGNISITHNSGASGTVNMTGGSFTCASGETWIGENGGPAIWNMGGGTATVGYVQLARNSDATGTLNLNSGTFTANEITTGSSGTSTLNFNGGTLGAGASTVNFLHGLTSANVLAGGAVINSGVNVISIAQPLLDGGGAGGLTKIGTGTLYLNGANTYTGPTLVNVGTLGGTGIIAGPVTVAGGAALAPGASIGTLTVNNSVTLGGSILMELSKNGGVPASDLLTVSGNLAYGGTLSVVLTGTNALAINDTFNLFDWGTRSGTFGAMNLPAGYLWDTSQLNVNGTIRVAAVSPPRVNPPVAAGGSLILTGVGGPPGAGYTWLTSTNVAAPIPTWTTNSTGVFDGSGGFSNAFPINVSVRGRFFLLRTP